MFPSLVNDELPAPFCFEKYNFNPFKIIGLFDYSDPASLAKVEGGVLIDVKGRRVNC